MSHCLSASESGPQTHHLKYLGTGYTAPKHKGQTVFRHIACSLSSLTCVNTYFLRLASRPPVRAGVLVLATAGMSRDISEIITKMIAPLLFLLPPRLPNQSRLSQSKPQLNKA